MTPVAGGRPRTLPGLGGNSGQRLGGKDHIGQVGNGLLERRVGVNGVPPDLIGQRSEVHFVILRIVEDAGFFGEKVADKVVVAFVLEKGFVRADHLGVFLQALADARAQSDEPLDAIGGKKGVAEDLFGFLPDAVHTACALDKTDNGPGEVVVDDDGGILQVLAFAEDIGGDKHAQFLGRQDLIAGLMALRAEAAGKSGRVFGVAGDPGQLFYPAVLQLFAQIATVSANWEKTSTFSSGCSRVRSFWSSVSFWSLSGCQSPAS